MALAHFVRRRTLGRDGRAVRPRRADADPFGQRFDGRGREPRFGRHLDLFVIAHDVNDSALVRFARDYHGAGIGALK